MTRILNLGHIVQVTPNQQSQVSDAPTLVGAEMCFEDVYRDYVDFLWRSAGSLGVHRDSISDVVQDVFLVVHRRLPTFAGKAQLRTWIYGILLNVVRDHRRTRKRKPTAPLSDAPEPLAATVPQDHVEASEQLELFNAALSLLSDEERTLFVLLYLEDFSAQEISELLALSLAAVYSRARRTKEAFEVALQKVEARRTANANKRKHRWQLGGSR